jgi:hypothetical protein
MSEARRLRARPLHDPAAMSAVEAERGDPSGLRVLDKTDDARLMFAGSGSSTRPTFFRLFVVSY